MRISQNTTPTKISRHESLFTSGNPQLPREHGADTFRVRRSLSDGAGRSQELKNYSQCREYDGDSFAWLHKCGALCAAALQLPDQSCSNRTAIATGTSRRSRGRKTSFMAPCKRELCKTRGISTTVCLMIPRSSSPCGYLRRGSFSAVPR